MLFWVQRIIGRVCVGVELTAYRYIEEFGFGTKWRNTREIFRWVSVDAK